jgi:hypothetical protein
MKFLDFAVNDIFRVLGFLASVGNVRGNSLLQVVDIVDEDAVDLVHFRINVARNRDVDEEHGPIAPPGEELFPVLPAEDGMGRACGSDYDVGFVAGIVQATELDGLSIEFLRKPNRPVEKRRSPR